MADTGAWGLEYRLMCCCNCTPLLEPEWFGPGDSTRHGSVSQDQDNTLDKWGNGLVYAGGGQNKLAIVHFGA